MCWAMRLQTVRHLASTSNIRMVFHTEKPSKGSGRFTNAKASRASNAARASAASRMAADQLTGARAVSDGDFAVPTVRVPTPRENSFTTSHAQVLHNKVRAFQSPPHYHRHEALALATFGEKCVTAARVLPDFSRRPSKLRQHPCGRVHL